MRKVSYKKLGDVCDIIGGGTPSKKKDKYYGGDIPWATVRDMNYDVLEKTDHSITELGLNNSSTNVIPKNHVVIATRVGLGKVCKLKQDTAINQDLKGIIPKSEDLITDYLFLWFKSIADKIINAGTGATVQGVKIPFVKNLEIPIPPLPEQKRIVEILDEAFEAIDQAKANIERNIENAEELFQSKLNEIFSQRGEGWEEATLGDLCNVLNGYAFKSKEAIEESDTQLLRMGNLYQNKLDLERRPVYYPDSYAKEYKKYLLNEGDLIMSLTGTVDKTDYGYTVEIPDTDVNLLLNQRIMKIIIDKPELINKGFLKNYLLSPFFLDKLYATASGTRQANLSSRKILKLPIYYTHDIETQKKIVNEVKSIKEHTNSLLRSYKAKWENINELKKSFLQKAFSGKLTANEHVAA